MNSRDIVHSEQTIAWLAAMAGISLLALVSDILADVLGIQTFLHFVLEVVMVLMLALLLFTLLWLLHGLRQEKAMVQQQLAIKRDEAKHWQQQAADALANLSTNISTQFDAWSLSPAERDVAWWLIRGLSFKEIGQKRGGNEKTARQQASQVYRKSGCANRAVLSGFFLGELGHAEYSGD